MDDRGIWEGHPAVQKWDRPLVPYSDFIPNLPRGRGSAAPQEPRESLDPDPVQGFPGRAQQPQGSRAAAYPLYGTAEVYEVKMVSSAPVPRGTGVF